MQREQIVIIGSEKHSSLSLSLILRKAGFETALLSSAREFINWIESDKDALDSIDLLIIDINLPNYEDFGFLDAISECRDGFKVIILSGAINRELARGLASRGFKEIINKPFDAEELVARVWRLLRKDREDQDLFRKAQ